MNCDILHASKASDLILSLLRPLGLEICNHLTKSPCSHSFTFAADSRSAFSNIDNFLISNYPLDLAHSLEVIEDINNFSDHLPIKLTMDARLVELCAIAKSKTRAAPSASHERYNLDWERGDKAAYYELTRIEFATLHSIISSVPIHTLKALRPDFFTLGGINNIYRNLVHTLFNCSIKTIHQKPNSNVKKPWWDASLKGAKQSVLDAHSAWLKAGKPRTGVIYDSRNKARASYRKQTFLRKNNSKSSVNNNLQTALLNADQPKFWRLWKSIFKSSSNNPVVNNLSNDVETADYFTMVGSAPRPTVNPLLEAITDLVNLMLSGEVPQFVSSNLVRGLHHGNCKEREGGQANRSRLLHLRPAGGEGGLPSRVCTRCSSAEHRDSLVLGSRVAPKLPSTRVDWVCSPRNMPQGHVGL